MRYLRAFIAVLVLASMSCTNDVTGPSSSCLLAPYTFDSNPNVQRCRASNGQFAKNECCGR